MKYLYLTFISVIVGFICFESSTAHADAIDMNISNIMVISSGSVLVTNGTQPSNTCYYYGWYLRVDPNDTGAKNLLATLLQAKSTNSAVNITYDSHTAQNVNTCDYAEYKMANIISVTLK